MWILQLDCYTSTCSLNTFNSNYPITYNYLTTDFTVSDAIGILSRDLLTRLSQFSLKPHNTFITYPSVLSTPIAQSLAKL